MQLQAVQEARTVSIVHRYEGTGLLLLAIALDLLFVILFLVQARGVCSRIGFSLSGLLVKVTSAWCIGVSLV